MVIVAAISGMWRRIGLVRDEVHSACGLVQLAFKVLMQFMVIFLMGSVMLGNTRLSAALCVALVKMLRMSLPWRAACLLRIWGK